MESVSLGLAFAAGLVSFASPCVLALVPVYLAFLGEATGAVAADGGTAVVMSGVGARRPVLAQALLFVIGFTAVFVIAGISVGLVGDFVFRRDIVRQAAGVVVIAIGLVMTGAFGPVMSRLTPTVSTGSLPTGRSLRSLALGALVGVGWTPCIGPVLGAILTMGLASRNAGPAALLLLAYSLGLAVPFVLAAVALPRIRPVFDVLRRHHRAIEIVAGVFVMAVGVLIFTNAFTWMAGLFTFAL